MALRAFFRIHNQCGLIGAVECERVCYIAFNGRILHFNTKDGLTPGGSSFYRLDDA
jgi:hypothetical protein